MKTFNGQFPPFIETLENEYKAQCKAEENMKDFTLVNFLGVLSRFRPILLQDAAVLYTNYPAATIFQFHPFNMSEFQDFANLSRDTITNTYRRTQLELQQYPEHVQAAMNQKLATLLDGVQSLKSTQLGSKLGMRPTKRQKTNFDLPPPPFLSELQTLDLSQTPKPQAPQALETPVTSTRYYMFQPGTDNVIDVTRQNFSDMQEAAMTTIENKFGIEKIVKHEWK
ncbi:hypothetical protein PM082_024088 [Marasmius tenuissimus]|nr:hypothetical protein PM082_024088 [Marasmius tenuissimus]